VIRKLLLAAFVAGSIGSLATPASAASFVRVAPPPPREEVAPAHRPGRVWVAGHWEWQNRHHVWVAGSWIRARRGYEYTQPNWVERDGRWHMERGNWKRTPADRDGDGVPNRQDRAPNNPNRS